MIVCTSCLCVEASLNSFFFFVNETPTTEISPYCHTLPLHDALPISPPMPSAPTEGVNISATISTTPSSIRPSRSEEHTSELQSLMRISYGVFGLKKKTRAVHEIATTGDRQTERLGENEWKGRNHASAHPAHHAEDTGGNLTLQ